MKIWQYNITHLRVRFGAPEDADRVILEVAKHHSRSMDYKIMYRVKRIHPISKQPNKDNIHQSIELARAIRCHHPVATDQQIEIIRQGMLEVCATCCGIKNEDTVCRRITWTGPNTYILSDRHQIPGDTNTVSFYTPTSQRFIAVRENCAQDIEDHNILSEAYKSPLGLIVTYAANHNIAKELAELYKSGKLTESPVWCEQCRKTHMAVTKVTAVGPFILFHRGDRDKNE